MAGIRSQDYLVRLLMAGIPRDKIKITDDEAKAGEILDLDGIKNIYLLFDIFATNYRNIIENTLKERMEHEN